MHVPSNGPLERRQRRVHARLLVPVAGQAGAGVDEPVVHGEEAVEPPVCLWGLGLVVVVGIVVMVRGWIPRGARQARRTHTHP